MTWICNAPAYAVDIVRMRLPGAFTSTLPDLLEIIGSSHKRPVIININRAVSVSVSRFEHF